ncbi:hypothetical protein VIGAN_11228200, partial [Vigna angularis var. angularis]
LFFSHTNSRFLPPIGRSHILPFIALGCYHLSVATFVLVKVDLPSVTLALVNLEHYFVIEFVIGVYRDNITMCLLCLLCRCRSLEPL